LKKKLLFVVNVDWFFISHRLPLALAAAAEGYDVHVATGITDKLDVLRAHGLTVHPLPLLRGSTGLWAELRTFLSIWRVLRAVRPNITHLVTIKPVLYGGIAARLAGVPAVVAAVSGLGYVFTAENRRARFVRWLSSGLYRLALNKERLRVICQNPDDRATVVKIAGIDSRKVKLIRGSGVNLIEYKAEPLERGVASVIMPSRLLVDKGVFEFVAAARLLKERAIDVKFILVGDIDFENPSAISREQVEQWKDEGAVEVLGFCQNMPVQYAAAHIVCLPSYREGFPKCLAEAAASARAVVTTDVPGCRDAIIPGKTGLLVPVKDAVALADAIQTLVEHPDICAQMGREGRALAERFYGIDHIVAEQLRIYEELVAVK